eukprot:PhF_6_TR21228/c0_g1_i3/m.30678
MKELRATSAVPYHRQTFPPLPIQRPITSMSQLPGGGMMMMKDDAFQSRPTTTPAPAGRNRPQLLTKGMNKGGDSNSDIHMSRPASPFDSAQARLSVMKSDILLLYGPAEGSEILSRISAPVATPETLLQLSELIIEGIRKRCHGYVHVSPSPIHGGIAPLFLKTLAEINAKPCTKANTAMQTETPSSCSVDVNTNISGSAGVIGAMNSVGDLGSPQQNMDF